MVEVIEKAAVISNCGKYRYLLRRVWDSERPRALIVMLNPSTADVNVDDPTIRSCIRLCDAAGYGSFEVVNLFGWRAKDPKELQAADDPVGPRNDGIAEGAVNRCDLVIFAWGANKMVEGRDRRFKSMVSSIRPAAFCFGKTKAGYPRHPLYVKTGTPLVAFK